MCYPMIFPWISIIIPWSSGHLPSSPAGHRGGRRPRGHVRGQHRGGARWPHAAPGQELLLRGELHQGSAFWAKLRSFFFGDVWKIKIGWFLEDLWRIQNRKNMDKYRQEFRFLLGWGFCWWISGWLCLVANICGTVPAKIVVARYFEYITQSHKLMNQQTITASFLLVKTKWKETWGFRGKKSDREEARSKKRFILVPHKKGI